MGHDYITIGTFLPEEVLPYLGDYISIKYCNVKVDMGSIRYKVFKIKGLKCATCNRTGSYFKLQKLQKSSTNKYHFNLYGIGKTGKEFLMTVDHIIPKSKGGLRRSIYNLQTMCHACNYKKADKIVVPKDILRDNLRHLLSLKFNELNLNQLIVYAKTKSNGFYKISDIVDIYKELKNNTKTT